MPDCDGRRELVILANYSSILHHWQLRGALPGRRLCQEAWKYCQNCKDVVKEAENESNKVDNKNKDCGDSESDYDSLEED